MFDPGGHPSMWRSPRRAWVEQAYRSRNRPAMKRVSRGLLISGAVALAGALFALTPTYTAFETRVGLASLFHLRGVRPAPPEVAVVAIDGRTGGRLGLPDLPRDWPRSTHGRLVDELVRRGAAVIVFDMDFRRPRDAAEDAAFADSVRRAGRVVLFEHLNGRVQPIEDASGRHQGLIWIEEVEPPMPIIAASARGLAPFPLPKLEAAVDQFWTFKTSAQDTPTLPVVALQLFIAQSVRSEPGGQVPDFARLDSAAALRTAMVDLRRRWAAQPDLVSPRHPEDTDSPLAAIQRALYSGTNQRYLNYYGPPGAMATIPYHAFLKGPDPNVPEAALDVRGKVVFVGYSDLYDPGQPDRFYTVFTREDGVDLSGVEIAATAFANLLHDETITPPGAGALLAVLAGFGFVIGAVAYLAQAMWGVPLVFALAGAYSWGVTYAFAQAHQWWPLATPLLLQFPLALFIGLFSQYGRQRRRVRTISDAIRVYVPEQVSQNLLGEAPDPERVNRVTFGTCLATDMAGFSTIAERMKPGELATFLNAYFDALAQALKRHDVEVTEFRADAIMCAWTGQRDDPAVRIKPALAALEASRVIQHFNAARGLAGTLRVGLAAGEVYVGHAGGGGHFVYSIVGDCANTASRIEGLNKHLGTRILATAEVAEAAAATLLCRPLGRYRFVGKTLALAITEILSPREEASTEQIALCSAFGEAMASFESGDLAQTAAALEALALRFPDDGPTGFVLAHVRRILSGELPEDEPGTITMTAK